MPKTTVKSALVIGAIALLGLGLSGCSAAQEIVDSVEGELSGGESEVRDGETQEVTESGDLDVFKLAVGDCFNDAGSTMVSEIPVVPCSDPHDYEVYHEVEMPAGDFPVTRRSRRRPKPTARRSSPPSSGSPTTRARCTSRT